MESWLGEYTKAGYTGKGKHVYISVDGKSVAGNPLFAAWKSKSFTDNDLLLHFFILDLFMEHREGLSAGRSVMKFQRFMVVCSTARRCG